MQRSISLKVKRDEDLSTQYCNYFVYLFFKYGIIPFFLKTRTLFGIVTQLTLKGVNYF